MMKRNNMYFKLYIQKVILGMLNINKGIIETPYGAIKVL